MQDGLLVGIGRNDDGGDTHTQAVEFKAAVSRIGGRQHAPARRDGGEGRNMVVGASMLVK